MKQAVRLGFESFISFKSSLSGSKNLRLGASVCAKPRAVVPQRIFFNSVAAPAKLRKSMDIPHADASGVVKNKVVEMDIVDNCLVEKMTVQELRIKLRSLGVPAKGCKQDLISALKSSLNQDGEDSIMPTGKPKRKAKSSSSKEHAESISTGSGVSGKKRTKTSLKEAQSKNCDVDDETTLFTMKQKLSVKNKEVTDNGALERVNVCETQNEAWTVLAHKKPQKEWIPYNPRTLRPPPLNADTKHVKLMSWNVNGLRALLKLEGFSALQLAQREDFDVLCLQETKIQEKDVEKIKETLLEGYENSFWTCSISKLGYSGTAIISRIKPLSVTYGLGISDHDSEGRLVTVEFDAFYLLCVYVPNSGDGLRRLSYRVTQWDTSLSNHMKELEKTKPVILTGDLNCAHQEIDIYDPTGNKRSAGFTIEERQSFETNFLNNGFVDTYRRQHPGVVGYTYWGYRHGGRKTNKGWRLDYFLVSESIADKVHDSYILPDVTGSDHCPIGLVLKL